MDKLEPCPFCGGEGEGRFGKWSQGYPVSTVFCKSCDAKAYAQTEAGAIAAWNRRLPPALCQRTRLIAVLKEIDDGRYPSLDDRADAILALGKDDR